MYIVIVSGKDEMFRVNNHLSDFKVSQVGYSVLENARDFCKSRIDKPITKDGWHYKSSEYNYDIVEVTIS